MRDDRQEIDAKTLVGHIRAIRREGLRSGQVWLPGIGVELRFWELQTMIASLRTQKRHCESKIEELQSRVEWRPCDESSQDFRYYETWRRRCEILLHALITPLPAKAGEGRPPVGE